MKLRLKKINRGLVLAAVLLIGLVIFIIVDNHNFKSEKPDIERTITDYVSELSALNITPEKYQASGKKYSSEDADKRISEFTEFADKYWITVDENPNSMVWYTYKNEFRGSMERILEDAEGSYITDCSAEVNDCKINKDGPNAALVQCTVRFIFTGTQSCAFIGAGGGDWSYSWSPEEQHSDNMMKCSVEQDCTIMMQRTSDGWKIGGVEWYDMSFSETPAADAENSEEAA